MGKYKVGETVKTVKELKDYTRTIPSGSKAKIVADYGNGWYDIEVDGKVYGHSVADTNLAKNASEAMNNAIPRGRGPIRFDDDLVEVYKPDGTLEWKGLFDDCSYRDVPIAHYDANKCHARVNGPNGDYRILVKVSNGVVGNGQVVENDKFQKGDFVEVLKSFPYNVRPYGFISKVNVSPSGEKDYAVEYLDGYTNHCKENEMKKKRYSSKYDAVNSRNSVVSNALAWKRGVAVNGEVKDRLVEFKKLIDSNINQGAVRDGYVRIVQAVQKAGLDRSPILVVAHGILSDYSLNDFYSKHKKDADAKLESLIAKFAANSVCNAKFKVGDRVRLKKYGNQIGTIIRLGHNINGKNNLVKFDDGSFADDIFKDGELELLANSSGAAANGAFPRFKIGEEVGDNHIRGRIGKVTGYAKQVSGEPMYVVKGKNGDGWLIHPDDIFPIDGLAHLRGTWKTTNAVVNAALAWKNGQYDHLAGTDYYCQPLKLMDRIEMRDFKHAGVKGYIKSLDKQLCICDVILDDTTVLKNVPTKIVAKSH